MEKLNHLNTYKQLDEKLAFKSFAGKVMQVANDGREIAYFLKTDDTYVLEGFSTLSFDLLKNFENIKKKLEGGVYYLILFFQNGFFRGNICIKQREGGYKESELEFIVCLAQGHSILEVLQHLERKLNEEKDKCSIDTQERIVSLDAYKRERKRINKNNDLYETKKW